MKKWVVGGILALALLYILGPFILPIAMGAILAALLGPLYERLLKLKVPGAAAGILVTLGAGVLFVLPIALSIFLVARTVIVEVSAMTTSPTQFSSRGFVPDLLNLPVFSGPLSWLERKFSLETASVSHSIEQLLQSTAIKAAALLGEFLKQIPSLTLYALLVILSLYFFLIDRNEISRFIDRNSFFSAPETGRLKDAFVGLSRSVVLASVAAGLIQAIVMMIFGLALSLDNTLMIAMLVFLASFIPLVGSSPVTVGVTIIQFIQGETSTAIALGVAALIVALVDNIVRPMILKGAGRLHPLLAFLAAMGGIQAMGFWGVFLGPVIAGLFVVTAEILLERSTAA